MTPRELRRLRAADRKRLRTVIKNVAPIIREAVTAAACFADSARTAAADQLGIVDYDSDTSSSEECRAVWSHVDVRQASRIYEAFREANERVARARELLTREEYDEE